MKRVAQLMAAGWLLVGLGSSAAQAEPDAFIRLDQSGWLKTHEFGASYGIEVKTQLKNIEKTGGGGDGGGGGLGGAKSYQGLTHRLWTGFGFARWLSGSAEQTMGTSDEIEFEYKVLTLQLRSHWRKVFPKLPLEVDTYLESRIRINARRGPSMVMGVGLGRSWGKLRLAGSAGFETTLREERRENGMRYEVGLSYRPWKFLMMAVEAWGSLVWPDYSVFQQDHHGGPSLLFRFKSAWLGLNVAFGMKERPNRYFVDLVTMAKIGVQF